MKVYFLVRYKKNGFSTGGIEENMDISINKEYLKLYLMAEYQKFLDENNMSFIIEDDISEDNINIVLDNDSIASWKIIEKNIEIN